MNNPVGVQMKRDMRMRGGFAYHCITGCGYECYEVNEQWAKLHLFIHFVDCPRKDGENASY